jgi:hypothetical protein
MKDQITLTLDRDNAQIIAAAVKLAVGLQADARFMMMHQLVLNDQSKGFFAGFLGFILGVDNIQDAMTKLISDPKVDDRIREKILSLQRLVDSILTQTTSGAAEAIARRGPIGG